MDLSGAEWGGVNPDHLQRTSVLKQAVKGYRRSERHGGPPALMVYEGGESAPDRARRSGFSREPPSPTATQQNSQQVLLGAQSLEWGG